MSSKFLGYIQVSKMKLYAIHGVIHVSTCKFLFASITCGSSLLQQVLRLLCIFCNYHFLSNYTMVSKSTGPNPLFPDKTSTSSIFGKSTSLWFEGHGMLHATYFKKDKKGKWGVFYRNKYAKSTTLDAEIEANGAFLPAVEGHSSSVIAGLILNWVCSLRTFLQICLY